MPVTPDSLKYALGVIRTRIPQALPGTFLEQALPVVGDIGLSAVVRVNDAMPGIVIRVPSRWPATSWKVLLLNGVRFEQPMTDHHDHLLPVMMADEDAVEVFAVFTADLASALEVEGTLEARMRLLMDRIVLWKRFFQKNSGPLSEEAVRGLIGELEILAKMIAAYGVDAALETWKGPAGELHDFHQEAFRIEVKTWVNESSPRIFISDPSQIVIDPAWPVFMAAVQLARDNAEGFTLPERIATILCGMTAPQRTVMEVLLADVGYLPVHAELYSKRFSVAETVFHVIGEGFPMIDPATLPGGITNLKYSLELGALAPFISASPIGV
jgi:hypothetical protein